LLRNAKAAHVEKEKVSQGRNNDRVKKERVLLKGHLEVLHAKAKEVVEGTVSDAPAAATSQSQAKAAVDPDFEVRCC
jgi:hypothetical protein